ncbi:unnamed protein product [Ilex paraguariensis]|uniref:Uncharacterized protein n=1 Tax=Ilex paraguariensis TaxID=185542 RepID=A0ABC8RFC4_9AQUA
MDEASWSSLVGELIRKEVGDWDDELMANARFKAFSGQRSDWEHKYLFWRDLILKVARHLGLFIIRPSQLISLSSTSLPNLEEFFFPFFRTIVIAEGSSFMAAF